MPNDSEMSGATAMRPFPQWKDPPVHPANTAPKSKPIWLVIGMPKFISKVRANKDNRIFR